MLWGSQATWCHLCKEYQVGGFAAPVPCTYIPDLRSKIMFHRSEEIVRYLHPRALQSFRKLTEHLERSYENGTTATLFRPFEGLRSPIKQEELFRQRPPVTHVGAWHSAHQYGLAVDFVPHNRGVWSWSEDHEWFFLRDSAAQFGLENPYDWDRAHVEHPLWTRYREVLISKI